MKSKLTLILTVLALLALMVLPAQAESATATATPAPTVLSGSGWSYDNGVLTITANQPNYLLASSRSDWFIGTPFERAGIDHTTTELIVADGVTSLGNLAFYGFNKLTKVTFPDTLTHIGSDTFMSCSALTEITIPASVTSMGCDPFRNSHLTKITFEGKPPALSSWSAFYDGAVTTCAFSGATAQVYYPPYNGWTSSKISLFSTNAFLTWNPVYSSKGTAGPSATWYLLYDGTLVISGTGDLNGYTRATAPWRYQMDYIKDYDVGSGITFNYAAGDTPVLYAGVERISVGPGGTMDLTGQFSVDASFLMQDDYILTVADESVATIDGHVLTAVDYGRTELIVSAAGYPELSISVPVLVADAATSITLPSRLYAGIGTAIQLTATTEPASAAQGLIWSVADASLADIDGDMLTVTAAAAGSTTVTASSWNGVTASTTLHVYVPTVSKVTLAEIPAFCGMGDTLQLAATVRDNIRTYENQLVTFESSDPAVATVDATGLVEFLSTGTVSFTAQSANGKSSTVTTEVLLHTGSIETAALPELFTGETVQAEITAAPESSAVHFTWSSDNPAVASVDENGLVTALSAGTTQIIATTWDGMTAAADLTVHAPISAVSIDAPEQPYYILDEIQLTARVQCEEEFINRYVTWESSDPAIVSVDENGLAFLGGYGSATITATALNGLTAELTITIRMEIWDFALAQGGELYAGGTCPMQVVSLDPEDADPGITWVSGNPAIFTVDENGLLTGVSEGTADVTATAWNGLSRSLTVIVNPPCEHPEIVTDEAVAPTDYTTGLTEGSHCDVCGEVFVAQEVIPATYTVVEGVLVAYNGTATDVVIPADLGITKIGSAFFHTDIISLVIPEGVTEIGHNAFVGCLALERVHLPSTLRTIDGDAFLGCYMLSSINLPEGLTSLGSGCFYDCDGLPSITLPNSLTTIGDNCFHNCFSLTTMTLPDSLQTIGDDAFYGCKNLSAINIGCVSVVKDALIAQGHEAKLVTTHNEQPLPAVDATCATDGLTEGSACADCGEVYTAQEVIPATGHTPVTDEAVDVTCTKDGLTAGSHCDTCGEIIVAQEVIPATGHNPVVDEAVPPTATTPGLTEGSHCDNCGLVFVAQEVIPAGFIIENGVLIECNLEVADLVIPADVGITKIGDDAFSNNKLLASVIIPEGVTEIGRYAFHYCTTLKSVQLPGSLQSIGDSAFFGCSAITEFVIPEGVTSIGEYAFHSCSSLKTVTLPSTLQTLGMWAFRECRVLTEISIPEGVKEIGDATFSNCRALERVALPSNLESIGESAFSNTALTEVKLPEGLNHIGKSAFRGTMLTEIVIPEGITMIGDYTFSDCPLKKVFLPTTMQTIGYWAFSSCSSLKEIIIPDGVTSIDTTAFKYTSGLTIVSSYDAYARTWAEENGVAWRHDMHTEVIDEGYDATCTTDGLTEGKHCNVCGEIIVAQEVIPSTGHNTVIDEAVPPACEETGLTEGSHCDVCGEIFVAQESINAIGHDWQDGEILVEPTCTGTGLRELICANDPTHISDRVILSIPHTPVVDPGVNATCLAPGLTEGSHCDVCGAILSEQLEIPIIPHREDTMFEAPTCTEPGEGGTYCLDCGTFTWGPEPIPPLGHGYNVTNSVAPTCTEEGFCTYVCNEWNGQGYGCGDTYTDVLPALGHTVVIDAAVPPTCTEDGLSEGSHCSVCGEILIPQSAVFATGHTEVIDAGVDVTCTTDGLTEGKHCDVCGEVLVAQEVIPAGHNEVINVITDPTCTEAGMAARACDRCYEVFEYIDIPAGHIEVTVPQVDPTCTLIGLTEKVYCDRCGEVFKDHEAIPAIPHTEVIDYGYPATDTTDGLTDGSHCSMCGQVIVAQEVIPARFTVENGVLVGCRVDGPELVIPLTLRITKIGDNVFYGNQTLTSIVIPEGVREIGDQAFFQCFSLANVQLPSTLEKINESAFRDCLELTEITLPEDMISIGEYAFAGCTKLMKIQMPDSLETLDDFAFWVCASLTEIALPDGLTEISKNCFEYCYALEKITIPESVTSIGQRAFSNCSALAEISLPESLTTLGEGAFIGCNTLKNVTLPASVATVGENPFSTSTRITCDLATQGAMLEEACTTDYFGYFMIDRAYPDYLLDLDLDYSPARLTIYNYLGSDTKIALPAEIGGYTVTAASLGWDRFEEVYVPDSYMGLNGEGDDELVIISSWDAYARTWAEEKGIAWRHDVHTEEVIPTVPATQDENGLTEGKKCAQCGEIIVAQEIIPAGKHSVVIQERIAPTCTTEGLTEGSYCSECGEVFKVQEILPATADGHVWHNGVLTSDPADSAEMTYTCRLCGATKTVSIHSTTPGDADCNGMVDILDAIDMMEWYCGGAVELNLLNSDVNDDGMVDMLDIMNVLAWFCGWDVELK